MVVTEQPIVQPVVAPQKKFNVNVTDAGVTVQLGGGAPVNIGGGMGGGLGGMGGGGGLLGKLGNKQAPVAQAIASGVTQRYFLHATAKVTAEHHMVLAGEQGKPQNLLSPGQEPWNKWEAPNHNRSWVQIEFAEHITFCGIGFRSAGDKPRTSPTNVKIFTWHPITACWTELASRDLDFPLMKPNHLIEFPDLMGQTRMVRFELHNNRKMTGI